MGFFFPPLKTPNPGVLGSVALLSWLPPTVKTRDADRVGLRIEKED